jgi:hypothetical protein
MAGAKLTRNAVASSIMTLDVPGSDHRSWLANIAIPVEPVSTAQPSPAKGPKVPYQLHSVGKQ